ncbi:hypothetical protein FDUTEX481_00590 [Tolypothrix sp. PCC 7601]|nr:hypothetical protein FDUTEX481_00590 [Tolypothrix sp. PCC 7601]
MSIRINAEQLRRFDVENRLLAEVGKRSRGKGERFGIFPFPFNLSPFSAPSLSLPPRLLSQPLSINLA